MSKPWSSPEKGDCASPLNEKVAHFNTKLLS